MNSPKRQNVRNMFTAETDSEIQTKQTAKLSYAAQLKQQMDEEKERKKQEKKRIKDEEKREHDKFVRVVSVCNRNMLLIYPSCKN